MELNLFNLQNYLIYKTKKSLLGPRCDYLGLFGVKNCLFYNFDGFQGKSFQMLKPCSVVPGGKKQKGLSKHSVYVKMFVAVACSTL